MENVDLDEEEKKRRKTESIKWRNEKRAANTFLFCMTLYEIIVTVIIIVILFLITAKITFTVGDQDSVTVQKVFLTMLLVIFFGGLFLGFKVYKWTARGIIKHFDLDKKLPEDVLMHYTTKEEDIKKQESKR